MPQLSGSISKTDVSGPSGEMLNSIKGTLGNRVDTLFGNIFGGKVRLGEPDVTEILSRIETAAEENNYKYTVQTGITGKSSLVKGADELKTIPLEIELHHQFCRPDVIIRELKKKAKTQEPFDYYQQKTYLGQFLIQKIDTEIFNKIDGIITHAKVTVELLECPPQTPEEFEQQTKKAAMNPKEIPETPPKITKPSDLLTATPGDIWDTLSDMAIDKALRKAGSYINGTIGGIIPAVL